MNQKTLPIQIYETPEGEVQLKIFFDPEKETIWMNLNQIAHLFDRDKSVISRHLKNIFKTGELDEKVVVAFFATTTQHGFASGKTQTKMVKYYNLDVILSVGYRVNSKRATRFRQRATKVLKQYLIKGYVINQQRLNQQRLQELENVISIIKKTISLDDLSKDELKWILEIITKYTQTWVALAKYDEWEIKGEGKTTQLQFKLETQNALQAIKKLKESLIKQWQAWEGFWQLRDKAWLENIFANIYQTFGWKEVYPTIEQKAANLLYMIIKNHPFVDGNKRIGAFLFILFLQKNNILHDDTGQIKINDRALTAITLLIAISDPQDKDKMVNLVIELIK